MASHLAGLSPDARAMLLRRMEAGDARTSAATTPERPSRPAAPTVAPFDPFECFFRPFAPFTIEERLDPRQPGWLQADSQRQIWAFLAAELMPAEFAPWQIPVNDGGDRAVLEADIAQLRRRAVSALAQRARADLDDDRLQMRLTSRLGGEVVLKDVLDIIRYADILPGLDRLRARLPASIQGEATERLVADQLRGLLDASPDLVVPVALLLVDRLSSPAGLVRIAVQVIRSSDVVDLRRSPLAGFVDVALSAADRSRARLTAGLAKRREAAAVVAEIRGLFETLRGATSAVVLEEDKVWRQRLTQIRGTTSDQIGARIDQLLPTLRRAFRVEGQAVPDPIDVEEAVNAVAVFTATRRHRDMTALNEAVSRIGGRADQAVDLYGRMFIEALRQAQGDRRRRLAEAAPSFVQVAEMLHGAEHAQVLRKAIDVALKQSG